jgi:glycine/D-amino acid oxidase-like deaminating enzyme
VLTASSNFAARELWWLSFRLRNAEPTPRGPDQHVNAAEAVRIMQDCGARRSWGAFPLTDEARSDPAEALVEGLAKAGFEAGRFLPLEPDQQWACP